MDSKYMYDRVDVPENLYLHSDTETEDFGTGVYPISVISRKSNLKDDRVQVACFSMRRKNRCFCLTGTIASVLVLILIIAVASKKRTEIGEQTDNEIKTTLKPNFKQKGLLFEPKIGNNTFLSFSVGDKNTYYKYVNQMDVALNEYLHNLQMGEEYVDCLNGSAPEGKACRLTDLDFGSSCSKAHSYGYDQGRPCILLRLKLDDNSAIEPFSKTDGEVVDMLNSTGNWAENHVAVTCDGETDEDRKAIGHEEFYYDEGLKDYPISYHPATGFPVWFYPKKNQFYKTPAVMVHFNTIRTHHLVTIKCVAWAKSFNNGKPQNSDVYSTRFQIYMA